MKSNIALVYTSRCQSIVSSGEEISISQIYFSQIRDRDIFKLFAEKILNSKLSVENPSHKDCDLPYQVNIADKDILYIETYLKNKTVPEINLKDFLKSMYLEKLSANDLHQETYSIKINDKSVLLKLIQSLQDNGVEVLKPGAFNVEMNLPEKALGDSLQISNSESLLRLNKIAFKKLGKQLALFGKEI